MTTKKHKLQQQQSTQTYQSHEYKLKRNTKRHTQKSDEQAHTHSLARTHVRTNTLTYNRERELELVNFLLQGL